MKQLNEEIKTGQLQKVYLICGEEDYLKNQCRERIRAALIPPEDTVNYAYFEGKEIDPEEIISLADTMPFFAEKRLIVVENSLFFKNASPQLSEAVKDLPESTCLVFVESEVDKRGKLYKAVKDAGRVIECATQDEKSLLYWIAGRVKREGMKIRESTARYLLDKTGPDMENLSHEMDKLFAYAMGETEVTVADIDAICTTNVTDKVFAMVDAVAKKEQEEALNLYYDLLALREAPMRILYLLTRQFRLLLEVKSLKKRGQEKQAIAKTIGVKPFAAGKYIDQCRAFSSRQLEDILEDAAQTEELVKTGRLNDRMSVELFIVKYSSKAA